MIIITIIKPCSQATSTSSCMWRRWGSSPAQSLHSGYRRVGPSPGRKEVVKKVTDIQDHLEAQERWAGATCDKFEKLLLLRLQYLGIY